MLVEDETSLADVIARNLRARGHQVTHEATAEAALLRMAEAPPDTLVLDVNLPDHSGWEILRRLTAADRDRLHVVVISAAPISQKRIEEFRPERTLQKPFPIEALIRALTPIAESAAPAGQRETE